MTVTIDKSEVIMHKTLSTITMGGTITIVVFVILVCIGLSALLGFLIARERKRYKESKVHMGIKLLPLEKMIKDKLINTRANTRFCITAVEIDLSAVKKDGGGKIITNLTDSIAARIVREYNYPISAARQGKSRIIYLSKNATDKKNAAIIAKLRKSLANPYMSVEGEEFNIMCNIAVIKFPQCGNEYSLILRNIELALADAARNNGLSIGLKINQEDNEELNEYLKIKRAVDRGDIRVEFTGFVNAFNKERAGFIACIGGDEKLLSLLGGGIVEWLDIWCLNEVCRLIGRIGNKTALPLIIKIMSQFKDNSNVINEIIKELKKNTDCIEQAVICLNVSEVYAIDEQFMNTMQELNIAINIDCADNIEQYESAINKLKPRYALIDAMKLNSEEVENVERIMERYNVITVMVNTDSKIAINLARQNGIELLAGSMFGDKMTAIEITETVS